MDSRSGSVPVLLDPAPCTCHARPGPARQGSESPLDHQNCNIRRRGGQHLLSRRIYRFTQPPASLAWCVSQEAGCPVCKAQSWQWSRKLVSFLLDVSAAADWQACGQVAPAPRIPVRAPDRTCKARIDHNIPPHTVHAEPPRRRLARSENREAQFW